jgi:hypothetical protein
MNPNAELHEIGYLVVGGIGAFVTLIVLILRLGDLAALYYEFERTKNAHRQRLVAWERLLSCVLYVAVELYMVSVGAFAITAPMRPYTTLRVFNIGVFFAIAGFTLGLGMLQLWLRRGREARKRDE